MLFMTAPLAGNPYAKADSIFPPSIFHNVWQCFFLLSSGDLGVDIFFVLSGFLIADILIRDYAKNRLSAWMFLYRRFIRIFPAYFVAIVLYMVGATLAQADVDACQTNFWKNLLFVNNLVRPLLTAQEGDTTIGCMQHTWSIAVEFQFYLISPALVLWLVSANRSEWIRAFFPNYQASDDQDANQLRSLKIANLQSSGMESGQEFSQDSMHEGLLSNQDVQIASSNSVAVTASSDVKPMSTAELSASLTQNFQFKMICLVLIGLLSLAIQAIIYVLNSYTRSMRYNMIVFFDDYVYVRTYCRVAPYLAGIACAVYFHAFGKAELNTNQQAVTEFDETGLKTDSCWNRDSIALMVTLAINIVLAYFGPATKSSIEQLDVMDLFASDQIFLGFFARVIFGCCLAYQVYLCLMGRGQLLNHFLSSAFWLPFARLSYSAYLIQFIIMSWLFTWKSHLPSLAFNPDWSTAQAYFVSLLMILAANACIFLFAIPSYLLIEKTFMRLR
jgi:peptidoglycan/LPS O-acetylase OafA/YrhL